MVEVEDEADGASGVKTSGGELSLSVSVTIGGNVGGFGRAREIRLIIRECERPASRSTSSNPGTSGEDDRRRSNAEFKWSRKCVGLEVESEGATARRSERELLTLVDTDCGRLFDTENANGSREGSNSASNGIR